MKLARKIFLRPEMKETRSFSSKEYWNNRYLRKETSGSGSYGRLAEFKASIINDFVSANRISSVIELGCGDGNQLKLANYKDYIGFDVSQEALNRCFQIFKNDNTKEFKKYCEIDKERYSAELVLSIDVIFHLIEEDVFIRYIKNLFELSSRYVIIYSCNYNKKIAPHVECRKFTDWINSQTKEEIKLLKFIPNPYPYDPEFPEITSFSDFYIYEKVKK